MSVLRELTNPYLIEEFKTQCPFINALEDTRFYETNDRRLIADLSTGKAIEYDLIFRSFKVYPNLDAIITSKYTIDERTWKMWFGRKLYRQMKLCGFNQDDVSMRTGISASTISKYMDGLVSPSAYKVKLLARALHCTANDLIDI